MECFVLFIALTVVAILAGGVKLAGLGSRGYGRAYQQLVCRFGGTYRGNGVFRRPSVRFRYGMTWVTVSSGPRQNRQPTTEVLIQWPDARLDMQVTTRSPSAHAKYNENLHEISIGDDEFEQRFHVRGQRENHVSRWLSDGVRWQINQLSQFPAHSAIRITVHHGRLQVEKPMAIRRGEDLEQFTQLCLELFDQAMLTRSEGIEFVGADGEAQPIDDPICQICGETIVEEMVFCRRCRTPHHLDCWQYNGACSTYGCQETRYAVPTIARPLDDADPESTRPRDRHPER